jgi:hypothetical protein
VEFLSTTENSVSNSGMVLMKMKEVELFISNNSNESNMKQLEAIRSRDKQVEAT